MTHSVPSSELWGCLVSQGWQQGVGVPQPGELLGALGDAGGKLVSGSGRWVLNPFSSLGALVL